MNRCLGQPTCSGRPCTLHCPPTDSATVWHCGSGLGPGATPRQPELPSIRTCSSIRSVRHHRWHHPNCDFSLPLLCCVASSGLPDNIASCKSVCRPRSTPATLPRNWERNLLACMCAWKLVPPPTVAWHLPTATAIGQPSLAISGVLFPHRLVEAGRTSALLSTPPTAVHRLHFHLLCTLQNNSQTLDFGAIHTVENRQCCFQLRHPLLRCCDPHLWISERACA